MKKVVTAVFSVIATVGKAAWKVIGAVIEFTWENIIKPVWELIKTTAEAVWNFLAEHLGVVWEHMKDIWEGAKLFFTETWDSIKKLAGELWDWISGKALAAWEVIKPVWEGAKTILLGIWENIKSAVLGVWESITGKFTEAKDKIVGGFEAIWGTVKRIFGQSVNTVVGADMDETVKKVQSATTAITAFMEKALYEAVVRALVNSFTEAFKMLTTQTDRFASEEIKKFEKMTDTIVKRFRAMWIEMLRDTATATDAIAKDMSGIFAKMDALLKTTQALDKAKLEVRKAESAPEAKKPSEALGRDAGMRDLYDAVHEPKWWIEYKMIFREEMAGLRAALASSGGGTGKGAGGGATGKAQKELEKRARVRGTPSAAY
jgi:phage-related protein